MSVTQSDDRPNSYSDLDVQTIVHEVTRLSDTGGGGSALDVNSDPEALQEFEPLDNRLDNDEVAELVAFHRSVSAHMHETGGPTTNVPELWANYAMGVNLSGQETHTVDNRDRDISSGDFNIRARSEDNPGLFDMFQVSGKAFFKDDATGVGGGAGQGDLERTMSFKDLYGGPWVDAADDLSLCINMATSGDNSFTVDVRYTLYWNVVRIDNVRPHLGRI